MGVQSSTALFLLVTAGQRLCALGLREVQETLRPPPISAVLGTPAFVLGLAVIRGSSVPVVDLGALLGGETRDPQRVVTLSVGERTIALLVENVVGVRSIDATLQAAAPKLLGSTAGALIDALGSLDAELLVVLRTGRILPSETWASLEASQGATPARASSPAVNAPGERS